MTAASASVPANRSPKAALRRAAALGLKTMAAAADLVRPPTDGVVVLLYHQVGAPRTSEVNLSARAFENQLVHLAANGGVAGLPDALEALVPGSTVAVAPARHVVTFDDGTADFVDIALPLLVEHRIPATLYVATRWVDEQRSFWDDGTVLTWAALREAVSTGLVTIGSHTHSHALLDRLGEKEIADELDRSVGLIGEHLGVTAEHFAYPKALAPSPVADLAVRDRFRSAALAGTQANRLSATDPFRLARTPVQVSDGFRWFERKAAGGMRVEDQLRQVVNRRRYAGASS
jgi:peptidoglycan/xylan/chitin deacetylase (PgdA/CDA1 family)